MNKFQQHIKSLPESGPSFQQATPLGVTVITKGDGWVRGVTRQTYSQVQQIPRADLDLSALSGMKVRHLDINLTEQIFIQSHS